MVALRLSKAGYGTPEQILEMRSELAIAAFEYERFLIEYEETIIEMNKPAK